MYLFNVSACIRINVGSGKATVPSQLYQDCLHGEVSLPLHQARQLIAVDLSSQHISLHAPSYHACAESGDVPCPSFHLHTED